jgi:hypothetical protein
MPLAYAHIVQVLLDVVLWMYPFMVRVEYLHFLQLSLSVIVISTRVLKNVPLICHVRFQISVRLSQRPLFDSHFISGTIDWHGVVYRSTWNIITDYVLSGTL